ALIQNESGVMPLMSAVRRQDLKSARDLLHRGADPNEVSAITPNFFAPRWADKSETPLMAAVRKGGRGHGPPSRVSRGARPLARRARKNDDGTRCRAPAEPVLGCVALRGGEARIHADS